MAHFTPPRPAVYGDGVSDGDDLPKEDFDVDDLENLLVLRRSGGRLSVVQMRALAESPDLRSEERAALHAEIAQHETDDPELPPQPPTEAEQPHAAEHAEGSAGGGLGQSDWFKRLKQFFTR